jgi:ABC-type lipoprotein export system ATPase subunit
VSKARASRGKDPTVRAAEAPHHKITSLEVTSGFLKGLKLELADGLNCVIGGRGTGKTTVLELIRYVLSLMPDEKLSPARARALKAVVQNNLGNGRVRISVQTKHGIRYHAERGWNEATRVYNEQGEATPISFGRDLIFTTDVYSQNEIEEIATNPSFQLALIDKFIDEDVRRIDGELRKLQRELDANAGELLRLDQELADLEENVAELPAIEEKLKGFQSAGGGEAKSTNAAHAQSALREKERRTLEALHADLQKVSVDLPSVMTGLVRRLESRLDADMTDGPNKDLFAAISTHVQGLSQLLARTATEISKHAVQADEAIATEERRLAERHVMRDAEYRDLLAKLQEETGSAKERAQLQTRHAEVLTAGKELELRKRERRDSHLQRQELTARLSTLRDERYALRKKVTEQLNQQLQPMIRVSISQAGNRDGYRALLTESLKGQNLKYAAVVDKVVQNAAPEELSLLVQTGDAEGLSDRIGIDQQRSQRVIEAFRGSQLVYLLDTIELEDLPRIELFDGEYKDSTDLSTGQRCTTILPILLLESERPLLVDQPEDNLDNRFIFETVVRNLKNAKGKRQLIFVTHNPNIPVLGDAERIFLLDSTGKQGTLTKVGTVEELKQDIEELLEGGREAFLLRKERYGH